MRRALVIVDNRNGLMDIVRGRLRGAGATRKAQPAGGGARCSRGHDGPWTERGYRVRTRMQPRRPGAGTGTHGTHTHGTHTHDTHTHDKEDKMRRRARWLVAGAAVAAALVAARRSRSPASRKARRVLAQGTRKLRYGEGRLEGAWYRLTGREPDPAVTDGVLADRIRSSLGRTEKDLDLPHVHVMVERHVALLHGAVASEEDAAQIEARTAAVPGVVGVESYLHVGLGSFDTRPSAGRAVHQPSAALRSLLDAAQRAGVTHDAAPLVVRGVLATFADRLPPVHREHLSSNLPGDVRPLFTPPRRLRGAAPARSLHDLVGRVVVTTSAVPLASAERVTVDVVHALRDLVPGDTREIASVLPGELRRMWESPAAA